MTDRRATVGEKRPFILIQHYDFKTQAWSETEATRNVDLLPLRTGRYLVADFARALYSLPRFDALIFRYLNDPPSLRQALLTLVAEISIACIARISGVSVLWICHNIDRESQTNYWRLNRWKRALLARIANRILVTDPLLIFHARHLLGSAVGHKIGVATFGKLAKSYQTDKALLKRILQFAQAFRSQAKRAGKTPMIGLLAGQTGLKMLHFDKAPALLDADCGSEFIIGLIVIGPVYANATSTQLEALAKLSDHRHALFEPEDHQINEYELADYIDFFWRGYRDISMSYTLYVAASVEKPVLALRTGFVSEAVAYYQLGASVDPQLTTLEQALEAIRRWQPQAAKYFLANHTWETGARNLIDG